MTTDRRIRFGDMLIPYDDALVDITIKRTNMDVLSAIPGDDQNCMNSRCIKAQRNHRAFPHPVYAVSTIKSRVYIVDVLTDAGEFAHAIRYELSEKDSRLIGEHDSHGAGEPGVLTLRVPRNPKGSSHSSGWDQEKRDKYDNNRKYSGRSNRPVTGIGASARYKVAVGALNLDNDV